MGNSLSEVYQRCPPDGGTRLTPSAGSVGDVKSFYQFLGSMRASHGLNLRQLESSAQRLSSPEPDKEPKVIKDISVLVCDHGW